MNHKVRKAVFPVGGLGTRFLPATKSMPKEMLPVIDKPLIQYAVEEARDAGIEEFIFVTGRGKAAIEDHFDHSYELNVTLAQRGKADDLHALTAQILEPGQISYTRQQEPLGLGHAVWCARHLVGDEPFAVLLADDLILSKTSCLKQMVDAYQEAPGVMTAVMDVPVAHTSRYGILDVEQDHGQLVSAKGIVEKPSSDKAPSTTAVVGRYIIPADVFQELSAFEKGAGGEIQLTDALAKLMDRHGFHGYRYEGERFDCGSREGWLAANIAYAMNRHDLKDFTQELIDSYSQNKELKQCG